MISIPYGKLFHPQVPCQTKQQQQQAAQHLEEIKYLKTNYRLFSFFSSVHFSQIQGLVYHRVSMFVPRISKT